jgi:hypothetical protein
MPAIDVENPRTMDEFRDAIDQEQTTLAAAGFTLRDREMWLAGARWTARIFRGMQKEKG